MHRISDVFAKYGDTSLAIEVEGPPRCDSQQVRIEGSSRAFRMLAEVLISMANTVDTDESASQHGWKLVLGPDEIPQLKIRDSKLSLQCDPAWGPSI